MGRIIIKVDWLPDNYAAAPANEGIACIATARSLEELKTNMLDALHMHLDWMREEGDIIPSEFEGEWIIEWDLSVRAILHSIDHLVPKSAIAKAAGVNQQLLTHYASGLKKPRPAMRAKIICGIHKIAEKLAAIS